MDNFLYNLGSIIDQQFNLSDNKQNTLDLIENGKLTRYGKLGDFASRFDKTAERRYVEEGFQRHSMNPKVFKILSQSPDVTILIKKKEFSSLKANNKTTYLNKDEKLFLRASSILFRNKCMQISMYERLSKIEQITKLQGNVDFGLMPILIDTYDVASNIPGLKNLFSDKFKTSMESVRKLIAYRNPAITTTWTEDPDRLFKSSYGTGTGVIELTTVTNVRTTVALQLGGGNCSFDIQDPYRLMRITKNDIEQAISDTVNPFNRSQFVNTAKESIVGLIEKNKRLLNDLRAARRVNGINFIVNPDTYLGKKIRVIIDGIGYEINVSSQTDFGDVENFISGSLKKEFDPAADFGSEELGNQGLKENEKSLVSSIIDAIDSLIAFDTNSKIKLKKFNEQTNPLRKRMMLHYCGNSIIQPMDVVHVYMQSRTRIDNKIIGGLQGAFTGFGFMQNLSRQLGELSEQTSVVKSIFGSVDAFNEVEKSIYVGKDFPSYLWSVMRPYFVEDKAGTHVFAGLVNAANVEIAPGRSSISVSCSDNSKYFDLSQINFAPSIEGANGPLMDPVTPFNLKIDSITGVLKEAPTLLNENKDFLEKVKPKYAAGRQTGAVATQQNFSHQDSDYGPSNTWQNIFYPPEGMVYKWKEGIGSLTLVRSTYNTAYNTSIPGQNIPRATTEQAFAGQDVMNVLSLLVTGEPYNFSTFYKTILQTDSFKSDYFNDPSYFRNLQKDLQKNNQLWGNFLPFKKLIVSEKAYAQLVQGSINVITNNEKLNDLLQQRSEIYDQIVRNTAGTIQTEGAPGTNNLIIKLGDLDKDINEAKNQFFNALNSGAKDFQLFGDDLSIDVDSFNNNDKRNVLQDPTVRKKLRRKVNHLTRRMFYKVKANEDNNLFIVDDSYDKDIDLQAYAKTIGSKMHLFLNEYDSARNQMGGLAEKLDLEIFADSQGHIQARPPQYNRVPNSVFLKLLKDKEERGIAIFPQFLQDLYANQIESLFQKIEIVENQIRLEAAALSIGNDQDIIDQLISDNMISKRFEFISDPSTGKISKINIVQAVSNPDENFLREIDTVGTSIEQQATQVKFAFTAQSRTTLLTNRFNLTAKANPVPIFDSDNPALKSRVDTITEHLAQSGFRPESIKKLFPTNIAPYASQASAADVFRITKDIANLVSERQRLLKAADSALRTVRDSIRAQIDSNKIGSKTIAKLTFPNLFNQSGIPDILEHMIEDESYDDYGPGSGSRYIVQEHQIISMSMQEDFPEFTFIQVNGLFGGPDGFLDQNSAPAGLELDGGGNTQTTAYAVDYDLWRQYGFRMGAPVNVPFLSDPERQLAPYAVSLLNRSRGKIKTGTLTIVGNEFMQAGEVIYVEPTDMLWYIESVTHSITIGGQFTTNLSLKYGHLPGEYIPTVFDIVGKVLYKNRDVMSQVVLKDQNAYNELKLAALCFTKIFSSDVTPEPIEAIKKDKYGQTNINTLTNLQFSLVGTLNPNASSAKPTIELRYYYFSSATQLDIKAPNKVLGDYATFIQGILDGSRKNAAVQLFGANNAPYFPKDQVTIEAKAYDLSSPSEHRNASQEAWDFARSLAGETGTTISDTVKSRLCDSVIDIWVNFSPEEKD